MRYSLGATILLPLNTCDAHCVYSPQTESSPRAGPPFPDATQAAAICLAPTTGCQPLSWAWSCAPGSGVAGGPTPLTFHSKALSPAPGPKLIRCVYCLHRHPDPFSQELWETAPFIPILQMGNRGSRSSGDLPKAELRPESCVVFPHVPKLPLKQWQKHAQNDKRI